MDSLLDRFDFDLRVTWSPDPDRAEDAGCCDLSRAEGHLLAVFDGCGGLGAKRYERLGGRSGAAIASHTAAETTMRWFDAFDPTQISSYMLSEGLRNSLAHALRHVLVTSGETSELFGSMVRSLPTTGSIAIVLPGRDRDCHLMTAQAGDSRVYLLTPEAGLQQITRDELRGNPDALENLQASAPLSNVIQAENDFTLTVRSGDVSTPFALLCATDGVFGCFRSPMGFEVTLLRLIRDSHDLAGFTASLQSMLSEHSGDDSTLIGSFYGWGSYPALQRLTRGRLREMEALCDGMDTDEAVRHVWEQYRVNYFWKEETP
ncbi:MAG: protein phosphatase 2C domain-containing protein [Clostridia bacterium]|nr:protein phosphatase 2C domain-containing protein [Clostridia bacterium]